MGKGDKTDFGVIKSPLSVMEKGLRCKAYFLIFALTQS
jgi:hypothetical protein